MSLLIAFDTETTGLDPTKHEAIEVAAIVLNPDTFVPMPDANHTFNRKVRVEHPDRVAEGVLGKFNHYNAEVWEREAVSQADCWRDFCDWVFQMGGNGVQRGILVGHNVIKFDSVLVDTWTKHFMLKSNVSYHQEDTMYQYITVTQMIKESVGKCNLAEVAGFWGIPFDKNASHGAMYDATASGVCYAIGRHYMQAMIDCGRHPHKVLLEEAWRRAGFRPNSLPLQVR